MYSLLLAVIYLTFISLGLPDSLLGSAWPVMYQQINVPISYAGIITMIIASGTILSSLMSNKLIKKFSAGVITTVSVMMTAVALFGFSMSNSFIMICLLAIPYGLGAGAVDAAVNNYVALHYSSRHMNWLHCFWGVGATISPYIMSYSLIRNLTWNNGYRTVAVLQVILTCILLISIPLWNKQGTRSGNGVESSKEVLGLHQIIKIKGVKFILLAFFGYCALESTTGLWASSYFVFARGIDTEVAARFASLFYMGITFGRFLCGFIANKIGDKNMIRIGLTIIFIGVFILLIPETPDVISLIGLLIIGIGCAPIYPAIIHQTPENFGAENSQAVIGIQMASAYTGSTLMPPLFGFLTEYVNIHFFPIYLLMLTVLMVVMIEGLNRKKKKE